MAPVMPNKSFNRTRYGRRRKPGAEANGASSQPVLTVLASAGQLTQTLGLANANHRRPARFVSISRVA
jgi:hypothetical protein